MFSSFSVSIWGFCSFGGLRFYGTFKFHLNWAEAVTRLSLQKVNVEKNVVSDLGREQRGREKRRFGASALKVGYHLYPTRRRLSVIYILLQWKVDTCCSQTQICHSFPLYPFWMGINSYQIYQAHRGWHLSAGGGAIRKQGLIKAEARSWAGTAFQGKP